MAVLPILHYPDTRLQTLAKPVQAVDDRIKRLIADMFDTMEEAQGIGLAATQVNVHERVIVMDVPREDEAALANPDARQTSDRLVLINPELLWASEDKVLGKEGCLSVPAFYDEVPRHRSIRVRALDAQGEPYETEATGLLAVCIQHEMDHLRGRVFVEYLSPLKRSRVKSKLLKKAREEAKS
jgi:peptide deformylase